jgi:hypothetical protein
VLLYYASERFLFRLAQTEWGDQLIVKGAIMLRAQGLPPGRPTRDIDFLARAEATPEAIADIVSECLSVEYLEDGVEFNHDAETSEIMVADRYPGIRVNLRGHLDTAKFKLVLDVGFDDAVVPDPGWVEYPVLLDAAAPRILAYAPVTGIAEKYEAIVNLGMDNSRLKDFYDMWFLAGARTFAGGDLADALGATFSHRATRLSDEPPLALTEAFWGSQERRAAWEAFVTRRRIDAPLSLEQVARDILLFVGPAAAAAARGESFDRDWLPGQGWKPSRTS